MVVSASASEQTPVRAELFGPGRRATTVGLVLLISMIAFEAMGVGTAMPAVVADLGTLSSYAWPFVAFTAANVVGTVLGGRWCDVRGPRLALLASPALFGAGLIVSGTATTMGQLLGGRVLQGLGAGALTVAVYVLIAIVYPTRARPAVFALMSSAWVLPALIGPPVAAVVTEHLSWHWVFLGILPFVLVAVALVAPAARTLAGPEPGATPASRAIVPAALGAAVAVAALSWAAEHPTLLSGAVVLVALAVLVPSVRRLVPPGTFRARRGIAAVVAGRALLSGAFFTVNAYLPLMLTATHGWSLSAAGIPLIVAALGWSSAAAWQGRHPDLSRPMLLRIGFTAVAVGVLGLLVVAPAWGVAWLALPLWTLAGVGMGLGFSSLSYLMLARSAEPGGGAVGFNSSATQLADQLAQATLVGAGGALLAAFGSAAGALPVLLGLLGLLAVLGTVVAPRTGQPSSSPSVSR